MNALSKIQRHALHAAVVHIILEICRFFNRGLDVLLQNCGEGTENPEQEDVLSVQKIPVNGKCLLLIIPYSPRNHARGHIS